MRKLSLFMMLKVYSQMVSRSEDCVVIRELLVYLRLVFTRLTVVLCSMIEIPVCPGVTVLPTRSVISVPNRTVCAECRTD